MTGYVDRIESLDIRDKYAQDARAPFRAAHVPVSRELPVRQSPIRDVDRNRDQMERTMVKIDNLFEQDKQRKATSKERKEIKVGQLGDNTSPVKNTSAIN